MTERQRRQADNRNRMAADTFLHGTAVIGERNGGSKLTREQVRKIREALGYGTPTRLLAEQYEVSMSLIQQIAQGILWKEVKVEDLEDHDYLSGLFRRRNAHELDQSDLIELILEWRDTTATRMAVEAREEEASKWHSKVLDLQMNEDITGEPSSACEYLVAWAHKRVKDLRAQLKNGDKS